jgi:hypothetical protein
MHAHKLGLVWSKLVPVGWAPAVIDFVSIL